MADIVRLEENGVPQYIQTVPEAVLDLKPAILNNLAEIEKGKQVFSGASFFKAGNIATWNESDMKLGIYIVVSGYEKGAPVDAFFQEFFISKKTIQLHHKTNFRFLMNDGEARKVFYPGLTEIRGNDINGDAPHNGFVVREIYVV